MSGSDAVFNACFEVTVGIEGGYSTDANDPGNYTGGKVGVGELKGTKYGISAAAYPTLDIKNLSLDDCRAIYKKDYWTPAGCDLCPPALAMVVWDCSVNNGVGRAVRCLQEGLGVTADGIIGNQTKAALAALTDVSTAVGNAHGARILFMSGLDTWKTYGKGWSRRLALIPYEAAQIAASVGSLGPAKEA